MARVDRAGEAQHVHVGVHADLLFPHHAQVAVGQHLLHGGGDGAGEGVVARGAPVAREVVVALGAEVGLVPGRRSAEQRNGVDAGGGVGAALDRRRIALARGHALGDLDGDDVAGQARARVLESGPVGDGAEQAAGGWRAGGLRRLRLLRVLHGLGGRQVHHGLVAQRLATTGQHGQGQKGHEGGDAHHGGPYSCDSFCSIWSEVWIDFEFIS